METALINFDDEEKWEAEADDEEEEEEALSLCDLPVNFVEEENQVQVQPISNDESGESQAIKSEEDFNFGSWGGSLSTEPAEMCAADEVFFKGQILPLRHSVSSDSGLAGFRQGSHNDSRCCLSRSESLDGGSLSRFTSVSSSSRSSSTRSSHYSTSSGNSITFTTRSSNLNSNSSFGSNSSSKSSKPMEIRNNFNTHPSPKPQIRLSKTRPVNVSSRNQKSSMWDFFRLGLVRAPELELQDLKFRSNNNINANRNSVSRNGSCNSSNSSTSSTKNNTNEVAKARQDLNKGFLEMKLGLFSGCKCSVNAVETVPLNNIVVTKSTTNKNNEKEKAMLYAAMEEKKKLLQELKIKKKMKEKEKEKLEKQEGKQALSRHRTFEWLKELSHASYADEA